MEKGESRFQRIYVPVANARGDYLPKIANAISQNRAVVCVLAGVSVSPRNTSITYPRCRYVGKENRVSQGQFELRCVGSGKSRQGRCPQRIKGRTRPSLCRDFAWLRGVGPRSHRRVLARLLTCVKRYRSLRLSRGRMPSSTWNISRPAPSPRSLGIFALGYQKRRTHHAAW